jgi:hypothetical protein
MNKAVLLKAAYGRNNANERCGFPADVADELVRRGMAEYVTATPQGKMTKGGDDPFGGARSRDTGEDEQPSYSHQDQASTRTSSRTSGRGGRRRTHSGSE